MKRQIFGRKVGSNSDFKLLMDSEGASNGGSKGDPARLRDFEIANTHRAVKALRDKSIEGFVVFEGDSTRYEFTPEVDFVYPATMTAEFSDAFFAGRVFVPGEQDGFRFLLWGDFPIGENREAGMTFSSTCAEPFEGAFLCKLETGWLLVAGAGRHNNFRHTFFDDSAQTTENAQSIQNLGVPVLAKDEANQRVKADGVTLYSITGDEKRRIEAQFRNDRDGRL